MTKIRGEYWIQDGRVDFADGDVGEQNHEMIALNSIASEHIDGLEEYARELGVDEAELGGIDDEPSQAAYHLLQATHYALLERGVDSVKVAEWIIKRLGINMEVYKMLGGGGDPRLYVIRNEGWIAVRSNNIELYGYDANKKRQLSRGLEDILDEEGIEDSDEHIEFSVYDHKTRRSFDATLEDIKNTSSFARPQQLPNTTYNKLLVASPDKSKPMGSQSPRTIAIQQRQAMQTSEGSMGFKKWLKTNGLMVRRNWPVL
jgi:hypothetical protein